MSIRFEYVEFLTMVYFDSFQIMTGESDDSPSSTDEKDSNTMQINDATPEEVNQSIERLRRELDALEDLIQMLNKEQKGD